MFCAFLHLLANMKITLELYCFFFHKTWSAEELDNMNDFCPGKVRIARDQCQTLKFSQSHDPNFDAFFASASAVQNHTWIARNCYCYW